MCQEHISQRLSLKILEERSARWRKTTGLMLQSLEPLLKIYKGEARQLDRLSPCQKQAMFKRFEKSIPVSSKEEYRSSKESESKKGEVGI